MNTTLKIGILLTGSYTIIQDAFAQEDSILNNLTPETLWYLQKEAWVVATVIILISIIGFIYRASRFRKNSIKKETPETVIDFQQDESAKKNNSSLL